MGDRKGIWPMKILCHLSIVLFSITHSASDVTGKQKADTFLLKKYISLQTFLNTQKSLDGHSIMSITRGMLFLPNPV